MVADYGDREASTSRRVNGAAAAGSFDSGSRARPSDSSRREPVKSNGSYDPYYREDYYRRDGHRPRRSSTPPADLHRASSSRSARERDRSPYASSSRYPDHHSRARSPPRHADRDDRRDSRDPVPSKNKSGFLTNRFKPIGDTSKSPLPNGSSKSAAASAPLSARRLRLGDSSSPEEPKDPPRSSASTLKRLPAKPRSSGSTATTNGNERARSSASSSRPDDRPASTSDASSSRPPRKSRWGDAPASAAATAGPTPAPEPPRQRQPSPPLAPDFYKPADTKDFAVTHDPAVHTDPSKGKALQYRYDGEGITEVPSDPRSRNVDRPVPSTLHSQHYMPSLPLLSYSWDKNSVGKPPPPPPSAILVTGFPGSVTAEMLHRHFTAYGRIEKSDYKMDPKTGGVLSVCWIKFFDETPRKDAGRSAREKFERDKRKGFAQDGNLVALEAVAKANGAKIGPRMLMSDLVIRVVLDGEGKLAKAAAEAEIKKRHAPPPPPSLPAKLPPKPPISNEASSKTSDSSRRPRDEERPAPPSTPPPKSPEKEPLARSAPRLCSNVPRYGYCRYEHKGCRAYHPPPPMSSKEDGVRTTRDVYIPGQSTSSGRENMSSAVAVAVEAAKKRLAATRPNGLSEAMDIDRHSDESSESESEKEDDKVYFHRAARSGERGRPGSSYDARTPSKAMAWMSSPRLLKDRLDYNGRPYLSISKADYRREAESYTSGGRMPNVTGADLAAHFRTYDIDETLADNSCFYVTFRDRDAAARAFDQLHKKPLLGVPLPLVYHHETRRSYPESPSKLGPRQDALRSTTRKTSGWTDRELVEEAKEMLVRDLLGSFKADLKTRVVTAKVAEHVARWDANGRKTSEIASPAAAPPATDSNTASPTRAEDAKSGQTVKSISALPSFARRKPRQDSGSSIKPRAETQERSQSPARPRPKAARIQSDSEDESDSVQSRRAASIDSRQTSTQAKPAVARKKSAKAAYDYTSSEGESDAEDEDGDKTIRILPNDEISPPPVDVIDPSDRADTKKKPSKAKAAAKKKIVKKGKAERKKKRPTGDDNDQMHVDEETSLPTPAPTDETTSTKRDLSHIDSDEEHVKPAAKRHKAVERLTTPDPFEAGLAADDEDLYYLKLAVERARTGFRLEPTPPPDEDEVDPPRHMSGAARTEGYYKISVAEKMANRSSNNKGRVAVDVSAATASGVAVSRLARANTRGLVRGMELTKKVTATDTDVLKFNQLRTRKKQLTFARSGIEGYGLFAMEHIPAGEMVIEYVGELIRQQVADRREKAYERQGIGSSYLFRVDEDLVVDATKKGNLGRLINHCCVPNCTARIITIGREKKIVIYAKVNIEPGDEVTYDYHFPREEIKIPCLCGHPLCRKFLN